MRWRLALVITLASTAACEATLGLDGLTFDRDPAVQAGGAGPTSSSTSAGTGASSASSAGGAGGGGAPGTGGGTIDGTLIAVPNGEGFVIDATEVTAEDYGAFLDGSPDPAMLTATCSWNDSLQPATWTDVGLPEPTDCMSYDFSVERALRPNHPVVCVDWCDAATFCASRGAILCGLIQGGTAGGELPIQDSGDLPLLEDAAVSAWYRACSDGGSLAYPYGASYAEVCNDINAQEGGVAEVGSYDDCGRGGLFDMSGNAEEWTAECYQDGTPATTACARRGGAYYDSVSEQLACAGLNFSDRATMSLSTGFRCCTPR